MTDPFVLKLSLAPALIGVASWIARRWGPGAGGWFAALPFTSGPVLLFLAIERGPAFAARVCVDIVLALAALAAFAVAYVLSARRRGWLASSAIAVGAYVLIAGASYFITVSLGVAFGIASGALATAARAMPNGGAAHAPKRPPAWDIPLRMALAAFMVWGITTGAAALGPRLSGLLTPFPIAASILAASTHRAEGAAEARELLRMLVAGLVSFAAFFVTAGMLLGRASIASAFGAATIATLASHAGVWWRDRRRRASVERIGERARMECIE